MVLQQVIFATELEQPHCGFATTQSICSCAMAQFIVKNKVSCAPQAYRGNDVITQDIRSWRAKMVTFPSFRVCGRAGTSMHLYFDF